MGIKYCKKCNVILNNKNKKLNRRYCKDCHNDRLKDYHKKYQKRILEKTY